MNLDKSRVVNYLKKRHIKIDKMRKAVDRFACRANRSAQNSEAAEADDLFDCHLDFFMGCSLNRYLFTRSALHSVNSFWFCC